MAFLRNNNSPDSGMILAFPTCIYQSKFQNYATLNPILHRKIEKIRSIDEKSQTTSKESYGLGWTSFYACEGNYNSEHNLDNLKEFSPLREFIWQSILEYVKFVGYDLVNLETTRLGVVWASVNTKFSYHEQHIHPNSFLSGVYYVKVPKNSGNINFIDPRNSMRTLELEPDRSGVLTDPLRRQIDVCPEDGMLLLFPSWLGHEVQQNMSDDERVSIAFNIIPDYEKIVKRMNNESK